MTASICLPGTSQPIPGKQASFYLTGGALALLAQALDLGWLAEAIAYISGINFVLTDICNTDPPADPGITARDVACLFSPFDPTCDAGASINKVAQLIEHLAWYQWCECVGVATPSAPAAPSAPANLITVNPPTITGGGGTVQCSQLSNVYAPPYTFIPNGSMFINDLLPGLTVQNPHPSGTGNDQVKWLPTPRPVSAQISGIADNVGGTPRTWTLSIFEWSESTGNLGLLTSVIVAAGGTQQTSKVVNIATSADQLQVVATPTATPATNGFSATVSLFCPGGGSEGTSTLQCCPPPADLITAIGDIRQLVTYLQRYMLPFATIDGAIHSGVSGSGSFAVSRLIGIKIDLTTIPDYSGSTVANPNLIFDAGWVSMMTGDGVIIEKRITHQTEQWMPRHFQDATTFGYYLNPGFVASFTEIEAEP